MRPLLRLLLICVVLFGCSEQPSDTYDLVIKNGNVIDIESGDVTKLDVYIRNGRIQKLEESADTKLSTGIPILDASNKYILPGFWDNHVHFRGGDSLIEANKGFLKLFVANGITSVRDAGGDLTSSVLDWKAQISQGTLIGPTIYTSGPKIDGPRARWAGSLPVDTSDDVKKVLDSLQKLRTDFVKLYDSTISGDLYLETIEEAETRDIITSGHMPFSVELNETIDAGLDAVEHLYYVLKGCSSEESEITEAIIDKELSFWESMERLISTYDETVAQSTFNKLKYNDVFVVPTLHIGNTLSHLDEVDHQSDPYLILMGDGIIQTYQGRIKSAMNASESARTNRKALDSFFKRLTRSLSDADVKLLAGSDCGAYNSYIYPGISLHKELEALVSVGLTPLEALQASAFNGAQFLRKSDDHGAIQVGKVSDVVILNKNPLENIKNTQDIYRVVLRDSIIDPAKM